MQIPQILVQCFDHRTSFPFALVSRLRPGQGKANEHAVIVSDGGCQFPQSSSVLTICSGFSRGGTAGYGGKLLSSMESTATAPVLPSGAPPSLEQAGVWGCHF